MSAERNGVIATCRMVGVAKGTVLKFPRDSGLDCTRYHDENIRGLSGERVQADEGWAFCYAKEKNVRETMPGRSGVGSVWPWVALNRDTRFTIMRYVGDCGTDAAMLSILDLAACLTSRIKLTTGAHQSCENTVEICCVWIIDYAMLTKLWRIA